MKYLITLSLMLIFSIQSIFGITFTRETNILIDNNKYSKKDIDSVFNTIYSKYNLLPGISSHNEKYYYPSSDYLNKNNIGHFTFMYNYNPDNGNLLLKSSSFSPKIVINMFNYYIASFNQELLKDNYNQKQFNYYKYIEKSYSDMWLLSLITPALGYFYTQKDNPFTDDFLYGFLETTYIVGDLACLALIVGSIFDNTMTKDEKLYVPLAGVGGLIFFRLIGPLTITMTGNINQYNIIIKVGYDLPKIQ